jgi:hypothetical protein
VQPLSLEELIAIAEARNIHYERPTADSLVVKTIMSRNFPISRDFAFKLFSDQASHVRLFSIIKGAVTVPKEGIAKLLPLNQFLVIEHVEEANIPPRMMFVRYTLNPPDMIIKEAVPDPFGDLETFGDAVPMDKKKASVVMRFEDLGPRLTKITVESEFAAATGAVFIRGFIDHVWLNFFETLMMELRELAPSEMRTRS